MGVRTNVSVGMAKTTSYWYGNIPNGMRSSSIRHCRSMDKVKIIGNHGFSTR